MHRYWVLFKFQSNVMANPGTAIPLTTYSSSSTSTPHQASPESDASRARLLSASSTRGGPLKHIDEEDENIDEPPQQYGSIAERLEHLFFHHD